MPPYPHHVVLKKGLDQVGLFTWLHDRDCFWMPIRGLPCVDFWFKDLTDALLFKLMWC